MDREERDMLRASFEGGPTGMRLLDALDAAEARAEKAEERLRWAEAKASVYGGEWCSKNMAEGRGPCGACASCCRQAAYDRDEWKARAEKAEAHLAVAIAAAIGKRVERGCDCDGTHVCIGHAIERGDHRKGGA